MARTKKEFVYIGKRIDSKKEICLGIQVIEPDGTLGPEKLFGVKRKPGYPRNVGGIYSGAEFEDNTVYGLPDVRYEREYPDRQKVLVWQALSQDAESQARSFRMEKEEGKISAIEELLLPLRKEYASASSRYDYATREALQKAVLRALTTPPRKEEL